MHWNDTPCYMMNVPETALRDPNLVSNSDLGAWQVAFQSSKCVDSKYIKYLLFTCLSSSGHHTLLIILLAIPSFWGNCPQFCGSRAASLCGVQSLRSLPLGWEGLWRRESPSGRLRDCIFAAMAWRDWGPKGDHEPSKGSRKA